jgi:hypothetical protein
MPEAFNEPSGFFVFFKVRREGWLDKFCKGQKLSENLLTAHKKYAILPLTDTNERKYCKIGNAGFAQVSAGSEPQAEIWQTLEKGG